MRIFAIILLNYLFSLPFGQLSAQDYTVNVQQFGIEEGLSDREVSRVFKDKDGLLWMGNGRSHLKRYDGYEFKSFSLPKSVMANHLIRQNEAGNLMIISTSNQQLTFLNPLSGEIFSKEEEWGKELATRYDSLIDKKKNWYVLDSGHKMYNHSSEGIISVDLLTGQQTMEVPAHLLEEQKVTKIQLIDFQNNTWVKQSNQILVISPQSNILRTYETNLNPVQLYESNQEVYLAGVLGGQWQKGQFEIYKLLENGEQELVFLTPWGYKMQQIIGDKVWCIGDTGWLVYDIAGDFLFALNRTDYDEKLFEGIDFTTISMDETGNFYIPTSFGLNIIEVKKSPFTQYFSKQPYKSLPINNEARNIYVENDTIVGIFEYGGIVLFKKNKPTDYQVILAESINPSILTMSVYSGRNILRDTKKNFWTDISIHLTKWSPDFSQKEEYNAIHSPHEAVWSLFEDEQGCIWGGYNHALKIICPGETKVNWFKHSETGLSFKNLLIYQIQKGEDGYLWLCTDKGLFRFDIATKKVVAHYHQEGIEDLKLPATDIFFLHIDKDKNRWLGTRSGLVFWNTTTGKKRLFTRINGLSNEVIYAVFEDDYNRLWLSSDYGIMSFDKETFDVQTYLPKDGVAQEEFNRISHFQEPDGTIYFGGLNGITAFHPKNFTTAKRSYARLTISDFELFDGEAGKLVNKLEEVTKTKSITFHPNDRFFRLKFTLPTLEKTSRILYGWKIDGVDTDWNYQKENFLQIGILPYGNHTLRIKGQSGGGWSPHEIAIPIEVLRPFYLQIWFILSVILTLMAASYFFYKRRTRLLKETQKLLETEIKKAIIKITKQTEELKQLDEVKSRFFANVTHELRTPLTLMLGPISSVLKSGDLSNRSFTLLKKAQYGGQDLLKLIGSILDLSKMEAGKIELREKPEILFRLIRRIVSVFESYAQQEGIHFTLNYQAEENLQLGLDKDKLEIVLNNLLSNAIKFTNKDGKITVMVEDLKNKIKISVKDTGRGIHPDDLPYVFNRFYQSKQANAPTEGGTGIGLALSQEFVALMSGKIWVESEFGQGSTFFVELPRSEVLSMVDEQELENEESKQPMVMPQKTEMPSSAIETPQSIELLTQTLLIVEDNHSLRDYLKTILEPYYNIITAENGAIALELLNSINQEETIKKLLPALILSDIMMPKMDGYQLLQHLKEHEAWYNIPVIMLTARADIHDKLKALRIGVDDYLLKPFAEEELLARIENLIKHYEEKKTVITQTPAETSTNVKADSPTIALADQKWLSTIEEYLKDQIGNHHFSISLMATAFAMSESTLLRQLKRITGLTPAKYVQEIRLTEARTLLENKTFTSISEVAYHVGFKDAKAFTRSFKKRFGKAPSEYL